jgi:hypothetical protein
MEIKCPKLLNGYDTQETCRNYFTSLARAFHVRGLRQRVFLRGNTYWLLVF